MRRATIPRNRIESLLMAEEQEWREASVVGERAYLCPDGWSLAWRGVVVYDLDLGRNVLLPVWTFHGKAQDARGPA